MSGYTCPECGSTGVFVRKVIVVEENWCGEECEELILDEQDVPANMYIECQECGELCEDALEIYDTWAQG